MLFKAGFVVVEWSFSLVSACDSFLRFCPIEKTDQLDLVGIELQFFLRILYV